MGTDGGVQGIAGSGTHIVRRNQHVRGDPSVRFVAQKSKMAGLSTTVLFPNKYSAFEIAADETHCWVSCGYYSSRSEFSPNFMSKAVVASDT